jgi:hypothetical protein
LLFGAPLVVPPPAPPATTTTSNNLVPLDGPDGENVPGDVNLCSKFLPKDVKFLLPIIPPFDLAI